MDYTEYGWSPEEIQRQHPYLTHAEIYSALAYYFDHTEEIEQELEAEWEAVQRLADRTPPPSASGRRARERGSGGDRRETRRARSGPAAQPTAREGHRAGREAWVGS